MNSHRHEDYIKLIDSLIKKIPSQADLLLDMRLAVHETTEPGFWVKSYFNLSKQLSGWYHDELKSLRQLLETHIQLEVVLEQSKKRARCCLGLGSSRDLYDYCEDQMRRVSLHFKDAHHIKMGFCWSEAA